MGTVGAGDCQGSPESTFCSCDQSTAYLKMLLQEVGQRETDGTEVLERYICHTGRMILVELPRNRMVDFTLSSSSSE